MEYSTRSALKVSSSIAFTSYIDLILSLSHFSHFMLTFSFILFLGVTTGKCLQTLKLFSLIQD